MSFSSIVPIGGAGPSDPTEGRTSTSNTDPSSADVLLESSTQSLANKSLSQSDKVYIFGALDGDREGPSWEWNCERVAKILESANPTATANFLNTLPWENLPKFADVIGCMDIEKAAATLDEVNLDRIKILLIIHDSISEYTSQYLIGLGWKDFQYYDQTIKILMAMKSEKVAEVLRSIAVDTFPSMDGEKILRRILHAHPRDVAKLIGYVERQGEDGAKIAAKLLCEMYLLIHEINVIREFNKVQSALAFMDQFCASRIIQNMEPLYIDFLTQHYAAYHNKFYMRMCGQFSDNAITNDSAKDLWKEFRANTIREAPLWKAARYINSHAVRGKITLELIQMEDCSKATSIIERMAEDPQEAAAVLEDYTIFENSLMEINKKSLAKILLHLKDPKIALKILFLRKTRCELTSTMNELLDYPASHTSKIMNLVDSHTFIKIMGLKKRPYALNTENLMEFCSLNEFWYFDIPERKRKHEKVAELMNLMETKKVIEIMNLLSYDDVRKLINLMRQEAVARIKILLQSSEMGGITSLITYGYMFETINLTKSSKTFSSKQANTDTSWQDKEIQYVGKNLIFSRMLLFSTLSGAFSGSFFWIIFLIGKASLVGATITSIVLVAAAVFVLSLYRRPLLRLWDSVISKLSRDQLVTISKH
ncbi:MAG: hypothetical protein LBI69_03660 [Puniceicoccales bacterium]|jgi:hypothetical protein|nr:hypothetical protein [Puniceicoccales bacterium]